MIRERWDVDREGTGNQDPLMMRCLTAGLCTTVAALVPLALLGCGGGGPSKAEIAEERARLTSVLSAEVVRRQHAEARMRESACRAHVGRALSLLAGALSGYVSLDTYSGRMDEIATELDRIPRGSLDERCLEVERGLVAAEAIHKKVVRDWSDCLVEYGSLCGSIISVCTGANPPADTCRETGNLDDTFELELDIMRLTAQIMRDDWKRAAKKVENAREALRSIGTAERTNPNLPRSEQAVGGSVYGKTVALMCDANGVPSDAVDPCQTLRDVLIQGVTEDEEADLNDALSGIVDAYELSSRS